MNPMLLLAILIVASDAAGTPVARADVPPPEPSPLASFIFSVLPILLIALFIWFFFFRSLKKLQARGLEHNERVERLLDRIATALENRDRKP